MRSPLVPLLHVIAFAILPTLAWAEFGSITPAKPAVQKSSKADVRPAIGDWRSREQFEGQPRATVVLRDDSGTLSGSLTMLGMTRGADDRATLRVPFRDAAWDGTTLTFETVLPDNEGKSRWALRLTAAGQATLFPTADNGKPIEDGPKWEMARPNDGR